jgi:hypothetical protein
MGKKGMEGTAGAFAPIQRPNCEDWPEKFAAQRLGVDGKVIYTAGRMREISISLDGKITRIHSYNTPEFPFLGGTLYSDGIAYPVERPGKIIAAGFMGIREWRDAWTAQSYDPERVRAGEDVLTLEIADTEWEPGAGLGTSGWRRRMALQQDSIERFCIDTKSTLGGVENVNGMRVDAYIDAGAIYAIGFTPK